MASTDISGHVFTTPFGGDGTVSTCGCGEVIKGETSADMFARCASHLEAMRDDARAARFDAEEKTGDAPFVVARHATRGGFSIAILAFGRIAGGTLYKVVRLNESPIGGMRVGAYVTLHQATTEPEARKLANGEWMADMGRAKSTMIACGPGAI